MFTLAVRAGLEFENVLLPAADGGEDAGETTLSLTVAGFGSGERFHHAVWPANQH